MAKSLREKHPEENLHILVAKRNSGSFTYDGIELGGERVCQEIEEEIEKLAKAGQEIKRLSLVGYSLGGLVARFCVGLLYSKGFFEKITPVVCANVQPDAIQANIYRISQPSRHLISACEPPCVDGIIIYGMFWVLELYQNLEHNCSQSVRLFLIIICWLFLMGVKSQEAVSAARIIRLTLCLGS
jgi:hypothetical protein